MEEREVLLVVDRYALVVIHGKYLTNYIVACGYNAEDETWGQGIYFNADSNNQTEKVLCLMKATEYLYSRLNEDYITMDRMTEIAKRFEEELEIWSNIDEAIELIDKDIFLTENEKQFFEINEVIPDNLDSYGYNGWDDYTTKQIEVACKSRESLEKEDK